MPSRLAVDTSKLYARNLYSFLELIIAKENGKLTIDWEDEIIKETCVTRDGKVVHPALAELAAAAPKPTVTAMARVIRCAANLPSSKTARETG